MKDDAAYLAVTSVIAGTLVAVWLAFYLPLAFRFVRWYARSSVRKICAVRPLAKSEPMRSITQGVGTVATGGWYVCLAFYLMILLWAAIPLAIAVSALELSFQIIRPG